MLPPHPAAEMFPRLSAAEIDQLGADILAHGMTSPATIWKDRKGQFWLLDGINRFDAAERKGISICQHLHHREADGSRVEKWLWGFDAFNYGPIEKSVAKFCQPILLDHDTDPYAYVISVNIRRRHLNTKQKRDLIEKLLKAMPEKSNRQIADIVKRSHHTVGAVRTKMEGRGQIAHAKTHTDSRGRQQPSSKKGQQQSARGRLTPHVADPAQSAAPAAQTKPIQAVGNDVDTQASADKRKAAVEAEAAAAAAAAANKTGAPEPVSAEQPKEEAAAAAADSEPSRPLADEIMARFGANAKWHALDAIAEDLEASKAVVDAALRTLEGPPHRAKVEFKTVGVQPHCRIFHADKIVRLSEPKEKMGPHIESLKRQGKTNAATVSITSVNYDAHRLQQIIDEWAALPRDSVCETRPPPAASNGAQVNEIRLESDSTEDGIPDFLQREGPARRRP